MTVAEIRKKTADRMAATPGESDKRLPCATCGEVTLIATLRDFGARCFGCYQAYCRDPAVQHPRSRASLAIRAEIEAMGKGLPL